MFEPASPDKTLAIVVGIETYGPGLHALDGPANDALRFIEWLGALKVPPKNIITHIAPIPERAEDCRTRLALAHALTKKGQRAAAIKQYKIVLRHEPRNRDAKRAIVLYDGWMSS